VAKPLPNTIILTLNNKNSGFTTNRTTTNHQHHGRNNPYLKPEAKSHFLQQNNIKEAKQHQKT
jgi:hypothetical protein